MTKETNFSRKGLVGLALAFAASQPAIAAVIEGRVTDGTGSVGLEGAIVEIEGTGFSATTDRTGNYRIVGVPAGDVNLTVSYLGADTVTSALSVASADATETLNFTVGGDVRLLDNVLVTGQRGALYSAINRQRSSDTLISVLTSDVIGTLPDENVAESARRIPGLSVQNDQGEGRFVTIRGLDPSFNAVSVNGVRLPAPEGDTRAVALDVIDSDVLSAITVQKTLTPDFDGDGIGGSIDIETLSAFDFDELYLRVKAEGIYSEISEAWGEKVGVTAANTFMDGKLGIAGNVTYNRRDFGSDNYEADGGFTGEGTVNLYPEELEFRDYQVERERLSATLNFDYKLNNSTELYLRTLFNEFSDQEFRSRNEFKFEDAELLGVTQIDGRTVAQLGFGDEIEVDRDIKDRLEEQQIWSIQTGGETVIGATTWEYGIAFTHAEEAEPGRIDTAFRANDGDDAEEDGFLNVDITDQLRPFVGGGSEAFLDYYFNADNFEFDELVALDGLTEDDEWAGFLNVQHDTTVFGNPGFWKAGVKARIREKSFAVDATVYDGFDGDDLLLSQFDAPVDYDLFPIQPVPNAGQVRGFFNANRGSFEVNNFDTLIESFVSDYESEENIYAAFIMGQTELQNGLTLTGGFRVEATDFSASSFEIFEFEVEEGTEAASLVAGDTVAASVDDEDAVTASRTSGRQSYVDFLPSLVARYDAGDKVVLRAGYYRSIARPNIEQAIPIVEVDEDREGSAGNPDLERQVSDNWDAGIEIYPSNNTALSVSVFHKSIDDYIATTILEDVTIAGVQFTEVETPINLTDASLLGVELSYQTVFDGLPSPFDGLLTIASVTLQEGDAEVNGRSIPLPRLSENVGSFILGYDKYGLDLRAAVSYRSEYLDDLGAGGDGIDRYEDDNVRFDFTAQYDITDQFEIQFEAQNLFDEPAEYFLNDSRRRLSQFEEYGRTFRFGVRYRY